MDKCNSVCPITNSESGTNGTKRKLDHKNQTVLHVMCGLLIALIDAIDGAKIAQYLLVDFLKMRKIISGTPDQSSCYFTHLR